MQKTGSLNAKRKETIWMKKYKSLKHQIEKLINDIYMEYIKPDDIVPALEKMI